MRNAITKIPRNVKLVRRLTLNMQIVADQVLSGGDCSLFCIDKYPCGHPPSNATPHEDISPDSAEIRMTASISRPKRIFVVSGPAGSGKTTVATYLSHELAIPFLEGDDVRSILLNL